MHFRSESALETRLAETVMSALFPCDLGDGIEVVHDVELLDIEMDCDLGDDSWESAPYEKIELRLDFAAVPFEDLSARERVTLHSLGLASLERSHVTDTLPFALVEPEQVTVPYPRVVFERVYD